MKESDKLKELARQNNLLREQNALLRQRNQSPSTREVFVDNIDRDEMRNGFLVTSQRKKLWNVQIGLINEFARVCKKHNLRWFAIGGTLLGAARHKGFIPWDDDVDVCMLRPEYEKFRRIVTQEVKPPFSVEFWHDFRLETDEPSKLADESLPLISAAQIKKYPVHAPFFPLIKIRDDRTIYLEFPARRNTKQGIWLDVFPLDPLPPFDDENRRLLFEAARILFTATTHPEIIRASMEKNQPLGFDYDYLREYMALPYKNRGLYLEDFLAKNFFTSEHVGDLRDWCIVRGQKFYNAKDFEDVTYLPFEKIEVPAPKNYDEVLSTFYGDWHKLVITPPHVKFYSTDISCDDYYKQTADTVFDFGGSDV